MHPEQLPIYLDYNATTPVMPEVLADVAVFESRLVAVGVDGHFTGKPPDDHGRPDGTVWIGTWIDT